MFAAHWVLTFHSFLNQITFGDIDSPKAFSRVIRCDQSIVQCEKLYRVDQLIDDVCERRIGYREAKIRLDEIINLPPRYPAWAKIVAMTASCAGCAPLFFGGTIVWSTGIHQW
jgi:uncharacterized membrane protein YjjP (DUF1212 family)